MGYSASNLVLKATKGFGTGPGSYHTNARVSPVPSLASDGACGSSRHSRLMSRVYSTLCAPTWPVMALLQALLAVASLHVKLRYRGMRRLGGMEDVDTHHRSPGLQNSCKNNLCESAACKGGQPLTPSSKRAACSNPPEIYNSTTSRLRTTRGGIEA